MPTTDFEEIKNTAIDMLYLEPTPNKSVPFFTDHPYFESQIVMNRKHEFVDIYSDKKGLKAVQADIERSIEKSDNVYQILNYIRPVYHLAYLQFIKPFLNKRTFDKLLAYMWVNSENPNQDANVDIPTFIQWFRAANKRTLMEKREFEYFCSLPDEVSVYRGVAVGREEVKGLSWTCNYDTAEWFSKRFDTEDQKGYILKGTVKKEDIFAYFDSRNEDEICCDSSRVTNIVRI